MIDEDVLTGLVRGLAESVTVPPDGPNGVLARRSELSADTPAARPNAATGLMRRHRVLSIAAVVVLVVAGADVGLHLRHHHPSHITVAGLSIGAPSTAASRKNVLSAPPRDQAATLPNDNAGGAGSTGGSPALSSGGGAGGASSAGSTASAPATATPPATTPPTVPSVTTKVVKTGQVDLTVPRGHLAASVSALSSTTAELSGYIASTTTSEGGPTPTGAMTLRVPAGQFETLVAKVESFGIATSVTTSGQDVTSQYVDLQARITALQQSRSRYLDILTQASTIGDILAVQQQIDGIQSQLDQLQGQLNVLTDQTTYATLTVQLTEPRPKPVPTPVVHHHHPSGLSTAWAHARRSFAHGAEAVIGASGGIAIFVLCLAVLAVVGRAVWAIVRRRLV